MIKVGIVGTGYGGRELMRLLGMHPGAELTTVASSSAAGARVSDVLPAFRKQYDMVCEVFDAESLADKCDVVFLATPSTKAMEPGLALRRAGARVIDIGPDFRLKNVETFALYYKTAHLAPELLDESVYGLPPWYRDQLRDAQLVAAPGCYPISAILPLRPLVACCEPSVPVVVDSISGISGAGRSLNDAYHFPEMNENLRAYKLGVHQHTPEIEQELGHRVLVQFSPHVAPLTRGILTTITFRPKTPIDPAQVLHCYADEPFVRVLPPGQTPEIRYVRGTNYCDIGWVMDERTGNLVLVSAIDNLVGGTAGIAIQCMNIMFGLEETAGLRYGGMAP